MPHIVKSIPATTGRELTRRTASYLAIAIAGLVLCAGQAVAKEGTADCSSLMDKFRVPDVEISESSLKSLPDEPGQYCDVRGHIGGNVAFAVYMPADWNGRFVMVGNGGKAGSISLDDMMEQLKKGFATASTDTGHDNTKPDQAGALFGKSVDMELDFAYRAVHDTAVLSKAMIKYYYENQGPDYSYWLGCSQGGRQGLMEAQRFPTDFDGYVVGAPVYNYTTHQMTAVAAMRAMYGGNPETTPSLFTPEDFKVLGDAVYAKCDGLDGIKDGLLADPRQCHFDPAKDLPEGTFSDKQIEALQAMYNGTFNSAGELMVPGLLPGSERMKGGWGNYYTGKKPHKHTVMNGSFEWLMFENDRPDFDYTTQFDFDKDPPQLSYWAQAYDAVDPDLRDVKTLGQKIIMYEGFSDPSVNPLNVIAYYDAVGKFFKDHGYSDADVTDFFKLYMIPGMGHCSNGVPGYNEVDFLTPLMDWVEKDDAPMGLIGTRPTDGAHRVHCPYPEVNSYDGSGDPRAASSFVCGKE